MKYEKIEAAVFKSRPNRFIAHVETERGMEVCHVKNTGRCRELLVPDARIWVQRNVNPARKTALDLIAVQKGDLLINMDSQIPNRVAEEWIRSGHFAIWRSDGERHVFSRETVIRPETRYGDSRIDLYLEDGDVRMFLEIKGVTLEEDGVARFPDAPTERGVKHVHELMRAREDGSIRLLERRCGMRSRQGCILWRQTVWWNRILSVQIRRWKCGYDGRDITGTDCNAAAFMV